MVYPDLHLPRRLKHGSSSSPADGGLARHHRSRALANDAFDFHPGLRFRSTVSRSAVRGVRPRARPPARELVLLGVQSRVRLRADASTDAGIPLPRRARWKRTVEYVVFLERR